MYIDDIILMQVVKGKSISEVAKKVVQHIRLPLLAPEELHNVEEDCRRDELIAVSCSKSIGN